MKRDTTLPKSRINKQDVIKYNTLLDRITTLKELNALRKTLPDNIII